MSGGQFGEGLGDFGPCGSQLLKAGKRLIGFFGLIQAAEDSREAELGLAVVRVEGRRFLERRFGRRQVAPGFGDHAASLEHQRAGVAGGCRLGELGHGLFESGKVAALIE